MFPGEFLRCYRGRAAGALLIYAAYGVCRLFAWIAGLF